MEKSKLIECIRHLNLEDLKDASYTEAQLAEVYKKLAITHEDAVTNISDITKLNFSQNVDSEWNYICLGFYIIKLLSTEAEKSDEIFLSVQQTKDLRIFFKNIVTVGICTKMQPNLPFNIKSRYLASEDIFWNYNVLKCTTFGLTEFLKVPVLRLAILPENLKEILVALYQISYCPLKKPSEDFNLGNVDGITTELYEKLVQEQQFFQQILNHLKQNIHPQIFVKETMVIFHKNSPVWFRKQVSQNLTNVLRSKNGVRIVATALFGDHENDNTQNWKIIEVFSKLILNCKKSPDFKENICKQLVALLHTESQEKSIFESIFTNCTKIIYSQDVELCKSIFIRDIMIPFLHFTYKSHKFSQDNITDTIKLTSRMLHAVFTEATSDGNALPPIILQPIIQVIFRFYSLTSNSSLTTTNNDLKDLLLLYLEDQHTYYINIFDTILFNIQSKEILRFRDDVILQVDNNDVKLEVTEYSIQSSVAENCESLSKLLKPKPKLLVLFFGFLLNCVTNEKKYFEKSNEELVETEEEITAVCFERKIVVYKLLSDLADDKVVQRQLNENTPIIVQYINNVLKRTLELSTHLTEEYDSEGFQSVFTILMILENLLSNSSKDNFQYYNSLSEPLEKIREETGNKEIKDIIENILNRLKGKTVNTSNSVKEEVKSELDTVIDIVCDALLPIRGHGLIRLTKLIERKDKDTMERKQFVLNILQQNITNNDSFIYLSAINGLAAMADVFPDTILKILCGEYSDPGRKDAEDCSEVRMKLGEVLVKVTKILGDMAPKYKSLLLNTFLVSAKDDDDLIRSSSLSNLGEICRVLGFKLGSMFTEVLVCVHAILATDKSPQARRAAVTVIRQLFVGLDQEVVSFFKEDILPLYRTLKGIYNNDKDDVMRLQAQLALEELNECMKNFVFPNPQLHFEKAIVMLD